MDILATDAARAAVADALAAIDRAGADGSKQATPPALAALLAGLGLAAADTGEPATAAAAAIPLRLCLTHSREFGPVLGAGSGGIDATLAADNFGRDRAAVSAAVGLTDADDFLARFRRTLAWQRLAASGAADAAAPRLRELFARLLALAADRPDAPGVIASLELELRLDADRLRLDHASARLAPRPPPRTPRPLARIDKLLHPQSIGLVGVSASGMNFGRIILHNLIDSGTPKAKLTIIRPGEQEIDGVRCVDSLRSLPGKLDLLIVAVPSDAVYALVDEILDSDAVEAVMLIPGGLGETAKSREPAAAMAAKIAAAHARPGGGPVFLGANCLGVVSHPGAYDSWFIPLERLPKPPKKPVRNSALLSQSGAFMITRLSQNPWLDPRYMLALGNQTDLTHGDLMAYFAGRPEIETIGLYIEGFRDGDGLHFAQAVRRAVLAGQQVVVYKAGRTPAGAAAARGHTASDAGDWTLCEAVLRQAGAIVARDVSDFDDLFQLAGALHGKTVGPRLGAISGAGFEAVGMADATAGDGWSMPMGELAAATGDRVAAVLAAKKLDALVEIRNPIDINPGADDEAHLAIAEAFLDDPGIDAVVVGLDPTAPAVRALEASRKRPGFDLHDPQSSVHRMPPLAERHAKPLLGVVDGGRLYDALAAALMDRGVCVFRNAGRAVRALVRYVEARQNADALRRRQAGH